MKEVIILWLKTILLMTYNFRQKVSTSHVLINLAENVKQAFDEGYISRGIFANLQEAFDLVGRGILLSKLDHYGILGISNCCFKSHISNFRQFVSINGCDSGLTEKNCGIPQGCSRTSSIFAIHK